jgi:uncharacterized protein YhdP
LTVDAVRARVHSVEIGKTHVEIADSAAGAPLLRIEGEAAGPIAGFLRYINESPVAACIGQVTKDAEAVGVGQLALKIGLPLGRPEDIKVGRFRRPIAHRRRAGSHQARREAVVHRTRCQRA